MGTEGISLWSPALILLGFQLTLLSMRIGREQRMGDAGKPVWIPLAEWLNLGSMMITVFLVIVPSLLGLSDVKFTRFCFAVSVGLLGGYPFALSAHYDLFGGNPANRGGIRVAARNLDGDEKADIVVGDGVDAGSRVTGYRGAMITPGGTPAEMWTFDAFPGFAGGVYVG